jgi:hypothetical protein
MLSFKRYVPVTLTIVAAILLQGILLYADQKDSPQKAVIEFSKAYFMLNECMADRICDANKTIGDTEAVAYYLSLAADKAKQRGFSINYMKTSLYHIKTKTIRMDNETAEIQITGMRRFAMNPLYALVAQVFGFSKPQAVDEIITVKNENGRWKVCGNPLGLPLAI